MSETLDLDREQERLHAWVCETFGEGLARDRAERIVRLVEEAVELAQAEHLSSAVVEAVVKRVYGRPPGDPLEEAGAVAVTLLAYCSAVGVRASDLLDAELTRIYAIPKATWVARRAAEVHEGIASPRAESRAGLDPAIDAEVLGRPRPDDDWISVYISGQPFAVRLTPAMRDEFAAFVAREGSVRVLVRPPLDRKQIVWAVSLYQPIGDAGRCRASTTDVVARAVPDAVTKALPVLLAAELTALEAGTDPSPVGPRPETGTCSACLRVIADAATRAHPIECECELCNTHCFGRETIRCRDIAQRLVEEREARQRGRS
jgi:hypothetical protein